MSGGWYGLGPKDPRRRPYRVDGLLGQGGMGRVYLGRDPAGRPVAIKMIKDDLAANAEYLRRFREEAANARRIARQHTAQVLDFNIDGGSPYLVTEYVKGQTLRDRIRHGQPIVGSELDQLAFVLATALQAMHQVGLIHRDLKPENVILSSMGPRVIDFGVARVADSPHEPDRNSTFVGTLGYIAPEILDSRPATAKVDIFAWGATVAFAGTARSVRLRTCAGSKRRCGMWSRVPCTSRRRCDRPRPTSSGCSTAVRYWAPGWTSRRPATVVNRQHTRNVSSSWNRKFFAEWGCRCTEQRRRLSPPLISALSDPGMRGR
ncbi:serine/threonine-protein kinase [Candidatus Frankia nodulisporulans]|uniref:serine/threonine-protein kinase n=1 Tax=Candidatus Frankia nodulisporulans TaxID=2060052 RepID=UPI003703D000